MTFLFQAPVGTPAKQQHCVRSHPQTFALCVFIVYLLLHLPPMTELLEGRNQVPHTPIPHLLHNRRRLGESSVCFLIFLGVRLGRLLSFLPSLAPPLGRFLHFSSSRKDPLLQHGTSPSEFSFMQFYVHCSIFPFSDCFRGLGLDCGRL